MLLLGKKNNISPVRSQLQFVIQTRHDVALFLLLSVLIYNLIKKIYDTKC